MGRNVVFEYYEREDVQERLLGISEKREVIGVFKDGGFSKRPNTLIYPKDIMLPVRNGVVSFHGSLERWRNPMAIGTENYEKLREGWDLILDLDCKKTEHGKVAAMVFVEALKKHGVKNVSLKFTGGTGFHLGIPFESIPKVVDYKKTSEQYPVLARRIAMYLRHFARADLEKALLKKWSVEKLSKDSEREVGEVMTEEGIDPYKIVEVDPVLISPRHLFRLPYSLHEKTRLVSLPLRPEDLKGFEKDKASPERVRTDTGFLESFKENEASSLVVEAIDWFVRNKAQEKKRRVREFVPRDAVPLKFAPPCVNNILKGLSDGRKRSLFILINYLSSLAWDKKDAEDLIVGWNAKNKPALPESYLRGQLRWHMNRKKALPPPNCGNEGYYESFKVCEPDALCGDYKKTIKNPINYAKRKLKRK